MLRLRSSALLFSTVIVAGCSVGTVTGEVDGRTVPGFTNAAFGGLEDIAGTDVFALTGFAGDGDSCALGTEIVRFQADENEAANDGDLDEFNDLVEEHADFINETISVGTWQMVLTFIGRDIDDVRDETFDVEDQERDEVVIALGLCLHEDEADVDTVDGVAQLDSGDECFTVGEGELRFELNDDDSELRVSGEAVEVQFDDGDKAGDVDLDFTLSGCPDMADSLEDLFKSLT